MKVPLDQPRIDDKRTCTKHVLQQREANSSTFIQQPVVVERRAVLLAVLEEWVSLTFDEVNALPERSRYMIETYCLYDDTHYFVPSKGFKKMDVSLYLNHSDQPNLTSINEGEEFEAIRDIEIGEELFLDYGTIVEWE